MSQYMIFEGNMPKLRKKVEKIQNKCRKYGCEFRFEEVGEEIREIKCEDGKTRLLRFVLVEAEGIARVNGWRFVASVEHTEKGNIIHGVGDIEVPEKYYTSTPYCEHCKTRRFRKSTCIVVNEETGEFKQLGLSCLKDYTCGMDVEGVTAFASFFDELMEFEAPEGGYHFREEYIDTKEVLIYAAETIRHFGFAKSEERGATRDRVYAYYGVDHGWYNGPFDSEIRETYEKEMKECGFDPKNAKSAELVEKALAWLEAQPENGNYMHNLKTACGLEFATKQNFGLLVSLFPTFDKDLEIQEAKRREEAEAKASEWVGNVGDRITSDVNACKCVTSWETDFGTTYIYKFVTTDGNILTWKTSKYLEAENVVKVVGTVKEHKEYRGSKQTEITRCKVTESEKPRLAPVAEYDPEKDASKAFNDVMDYFDGIA